MQGTKRPRCSAEDSAELHDAAGNTSDGHAQASRGEAEVLQHPQQLEAPSAAPVPNLAGPQDVHSAALLQAMQLLTAQLQAHSEQLTLHQQAISALQDALKESQQHRACEASTAACQQAGHSGPTPAVLLQHSQQGLGHEQHESMQAEPAAPLQTHLPQQQQQQQQGGQDTALPVAVSEPSIADPAAGSEPKEEQKGNGTKATFETVDDPSVALVQFSAKQLRSCRLQAGQEVRLLRKAQRSNDVDDLYFTREELQLQVLRLRGLGATGEVYDVHVLQHTLTAGSTTAGQALAGSTEAAAAAAAAGGPLAGQQLSLKLCRQYLEVPGALTQRLYGDAQTYINAMEADMVKQHSIMAALGDIDSNIIRSHMFGSICGDAGARLPALLMDRAASVSMDVKLQQLCSRQPGAQGLGKQLTHQVMQQVLSGLCDIHDHGWAYLDIKPANIVGSTVRPTANPTEAWQQYYLVDFGSAYQLGEAESRMRLRTPGTNEYMTPEFEQQHIVSYKADIWAMGILLLELRTGGAPHDELEGLRQQGTHADTLQDMKQSQKYRTITVREWAFIERCLAYKRQQRPTAEELYRDSYITFGPT